MKKSLCIMAAVLAAGITAKAQSAGSQTAGIAQAAGWHYPTSFADGRPDLKDRYSLAEGRLVFDAYFNTRFEIRENNSDFDSSVNDPKDASWLLTRFRLGALFHANDWLKVYVQGQDIRELGGSRPNNVGTFGADGDDVLDILQAWIEIGHDRDHLSLRVGRQPLNYGSQRLIGNPQWLNSTRAWDAVRLRYATETWELDFFTGSPVTFNNNQWNQSDIFDTTEARNAIDSGVYFSSKSLIPWQSKTDFYVLNQVLDKVPGAAGAPLGAVGRTNVWSIGTLMKGDPKQLANWDYDVEMTAQFGKAGGLSHRAFAGHWGGGYNFTHDWKPRLGVQYNYASGDEDATDGRSSTFQNFFPGNHALFGYMDTTAWMNMHNLQLNFTMQPTEKLKLSLDAMAFWNATNNDAWFGSNTSTTVRPVNAAARSASNYRGTEFNVNAWYTFNSHMALQTGYALFLPGDYLAQTGASDVAHFGYAQLSFNF
ncbi:MAG: alginate export family protein [Verrucomicrobiaceae bacterium]|nr:alginate export family protein [Verrucomicrobiaceae bacterium]